ncbi:MAG: sigma-70 family RNA polymerase sigma factor [Planctomycetota bacterium]|nr:MAG: sigma-70 family RNA polymerase sigma factor [Planctomycetota bacterium]
MQHGLTTHASFLAKVCEGSDPSAWAVFCARYGRLIRGFALRRGLQPVDADDVVQEVLLTLTRSMPGFEYDPARGKFRSYLKTLTLRAIYKKTFQKREAVSLEDVGSVVASAEGEEEVEAAWEQEWRQYHIDRAMNVVRMEFNAHDLEAFERYALNGESAAETAETLGLSVDQVYQAKSRIVRRLGELIARQVEEEG